MTEAGDTQNPLFVIEELNVPQSNEELNKPKPDSGHYSLEDMPKKKRSRNNTSGISPRYLTGKSAIIKRGGIGDSVPKEKD